MEINTSEAAIYKRLKTERSSQEKITEKNRNQTDQRLIFVTSDY